MLQGLKSYFWQPYFSLKTENRPGVLSFRKLKLNLQKNLIFILFFPGEACLAGSLDPANFASPILIAEMVEIKVLKNDLLHHDLITRTAFFK
jgi:hypothetical protein